MSILLNEYMNYGKAAARRYLKDRALRPAFYAERDELWDSGVFTAHPAWHALGEALKVAVKEKKAELAAGLLVTLGGLTVKAFKEEFVSLVGALLGDGGRSRLTARFSEIAQMREKLGGTIAWEAEDWWKVHVEKYPHHMLRPSDEDPAQVAYYESPERLFVGRALRTKPGRYLAKYFKDSMSEATIKMWADKQQSLANERIGMLKFIEHDDPDGWVDIYNDGPQSCMQGEECVKVYAHDKSVLRLAYWQQKGAIVARCIVRDDRKEWIRTYPPHQDGGGSLSMHTELTKLGYKHGTLSGVLLAAETAGGGETYVCPYIDRGAGRMLSVQLVYRGGIKYLELGDDGKSATSTGGTITLEPEMTCDGCGDEVDLDSYCSAEGYDGRYCESCFHEFFVYAYNSVKHVDSQTDISRDDAVRFRGNWYIDDSDVLEAHGISTCAECGEMTLIDDMRSNADGWFCDSCITSLDEAGPDGEDFALDSDVKTLADGRVVHKDWVDDEPKVKPSLVTEVCAYTLPLPLIPSEMTKQIEGIVDRAEPGANWPFEVQTSTDPMAQAITNAARAGEAIEAELAEEEAA